MGRLRLLTLLLIAVLAPTARAGLPAGDGGPGSDSNRNHVHKLKTWKPRFEYQLKRTAPAHTELNGRADVSAQVQKGQWWSIDCQLYNTTQNGTLLWDHIHNVGWVYDQYIKTYTDGRIPGSPTCAMPGPGHVWFQQAWGPQKEYRVARATVVRDRPAGVSAGKTLPKDAWVATNCHQALHGHQWVFLDLAGTAAGYVPAAALRFWQKGLPAGMPKCVKPPPPVRTWVAMGDSYASGQGANDYSGGSCRRSANSYWALLHNKLKHGLVSSSGDFVACSGATTSYVESHELGPLDATTRLVTLSVGGNNMGFANVMSSCVKPGGTSCKEAIASHFERRDLESLKTDLRRLYRDIRSRASSATVLVLGYPHLVPVNYIDGCGAMDDSDAPYLNRASDRLNHAIREAIGSRRGFRFVSLVDTFITHPACNSARPDWINGVVITDHQESFHPNEAGHRAIARTLEKAAPAFFR